MKNENKFNYQRSFSITKYFLVGIFMFFASFFAQAQNKVISGFVTDGNRATIPGVTVTIKGTKTATSTDFDGAYKINAAASDQLIFSFVGFSSKTITIGEKTTLNVVLESATTNLDEIVVIPYGTAKRGDLTGSVGKVSMADILKAPVRSIDEALAGRVAGVQVTSSDGQPGSPSTIVIRGNNSVTQSNAPLYVVDGFPIENFDLNSLNPQDILSIDVLKDASSTAIYGARGANGVIVIQTKKGKVGPAVFSFENTTSVQNVIQKMEVMSPYEFVKLQLERDPALVSANPSSLSPTQLYLNDGKTLDDYKKIKGIDWQDEIIHPAITQNYNFSVNGGTQKTKYAVSGSYIDQGGIIVNSGYERYQGRLVLEHSFTKKLKIGLNTNYSDMARTGTNPAASSFTATTNIMYSVWGSKPIDNNGVLPDLNELIDEDLDLVNDRRFNPISNLQNTYRKNNSENLVANAYVDYELIPGLKLHITGGLNQTKNKNEAFNNSKSSSGYKGSPDGVNGRVDYSENQNWLNENILTWKKNFMKKNTIDLMGAFTMQQNNNIIYGHGGKNLPNEELGIDGLDLGIPYRVDTFESVWTMASFVARANYNYDSRYFLTATWRADGSSKFPSENHWGYFPSGAFSWKFKNEKILKNNKVLSDGKFRATYGQTGNNRVGDFDYLTRYFNPLQNAYVFDNTYVDGVIATNLGNSKLKWETTEQINFGVDLGFLNQRITLTADVYKKTTNDLLLRADLPNSSGFTTAMKNIGAMENKGLELSLSTVNVKTNDFMWSSSFNISFNKNKVLALADNQEDLRSTISWNGNEWPNTPAYITALGQPIGEMYGLVFLGTYKNEDFDKDANGLYTILKPDIAANGKTRTAIRPGDVKYEDRNGDLNINADDYTVIGHGLPKHIGGFNNNFVYKGFDLNVFFQWSYGNDIMNANRILFEGGTSPYLNQFASYEDRWTTGNQTSDIPRIGGSTGTSAGYSTRTVEDGSYIRLKTISFGYNLSNQLVSKFGMKSMRFYTSAQNLYTWTKYTGPDPEVNTYASALTSGFDYSAYPRALTVALGVKITF